MTKQQLIAAVEALWVGPKPEYPDHDGGYYWAIQDVIKILRDLPETKDETNARCSD